MLFYLLISCTARCLCRRQPLALRHKSPYYQLHAVHYWIYGLRHVLEERLPKAAIRSLLLGSYDSPSDRCIKVRSPPYFCLPKCMN